MRRTIASAALLAVLAAGLAGCSSSSSSPAASPAASSAASPTGPAVAADSVTITYDGSAQFEIATPSGVIIFIDVWDPTVLAHTPTAKDFLLTTHTHGDHLSPGYPSSFPGQTLTARVGMETADGIAIESIPAAHDEGSDVADEGGSNYIFVIDVAGLRLAHFGDLGQGKLTDEQMAKLGKVDIAMSQLDNSFSGMNTINRKGFNQMNQLKPRVFIPTHASNAAIEIAAAEWKSAWTDKPLAIAAADLSSEMTLILMGAQAKGYGALFGVAPYEG